MISGVMPGTCARAEAPSGSAARSAGALEGARPAAMAAAGTSVAACLDCTFVRMVV